MLEQVGFLLRLRVLPGQAERLDQTAEAQIEVVRAPEVQVPDEGQRKILKRLMICSPLAGAAACGPS